MEEKLKSAKELFEKVANPEEKQICEIAIEQVKKLHLGDECVLACYLYYPYIKTAIYVPPSEAELKSFDETRRKEEDERKKEIDIKRTEFKKSIEQIYGEETLADRKSVV